MLGIRDMLTRNKENEVFLTKTEGGKIKGRIYLVKERLEDFKFEINGAEAYVEINGGIKVKIRGVQPACMFNCIENKIKVFLENIKQNGCMYRSFLGKTRIENINGRLEIRGKKIKVLTSGLEVEISLPVKLVEIGSYYDVISQVLEKVSKLDFYISLI